MIETIFSTLGNSLLGMLFLALAALITFLMFYVWKFPFDHDKLRSSAPPKAILTHRVLGYAFVFIYICIMWNMVPRLWSYQIELPARTVVHLALGIMIGALLFIKIVIVRYFKHMEAKLAPYLGTALFLCSFLLIFLVLPFSLRDTYLESKALGDDVLVEERAQRVRDLLPGAGLEDEQLLNELATRKGLIAGRRILSVKCVQCHDLRTVLARPRTPKAWKQTVSRMASRSTILNPITEDDQWFVTAYLVAVSPTLQETLKQRRKMGVDTAQAQSNMSAAVKLTDADDTDYDTAKAEKLFQQTCSQCHSYTQVENAPPGSRGEATALVQRMVGNGLSASETDLNTIIHYLAETYATEASSAQAVEVVDGAAHSEGMTLFSERFCAGCHGPAGKTPVTDTYPVLAGQNREYLIAQFNLIKNGTRATGAAATMSSLVQNVSDEEITAIADYLSSQK
jgi:cytochrome c553